MYRSFSFGTALAVSAFMKPALILVLVAATAGTSQAQIKPASSLDKGPWTAIKTEVDIQPRTRAIFDRAASLYGGVKTWRIKWCEWGVDGQRGQYNPQNRFIVFDRAGRIHVENPNGITASLVIDGTTQWELFTTGHTFFHAPIVYTREPKSVFAVADELSRDNTGENLFADLLKKDGPLTAERIRALLHHPDLRAFAAKVLPSQPFDGVACDVVRLTERTQDISVKPNVQTIEQRTFWFARSDGRLMRWQTQHIENGHTVTSSDAQVQTQQFNPVLSNQEFKFVPPKGAILYKP